MRKTLLILFASATVHAETGKLLLHFLQLPVGEETYELNGNTLHARFEYTERGSNVALNATLRMKPDLTPEQYEAHGRSYRPFKVDVSVTPANETGPFFTIDGYAPLSVQMMMLRYWLGHGKPKRLRQLPAGTKDDDLIIEETGRDGPLTRYSIGNVVWGRESVWLNDRQEIAGAVTYAGNLPLEAVREEYRSELPKLIRSSIADRIKELGTIPALTQRAIAVVHARLIDGKRDTPMEDATVLVLDGHVVEVGPSEKVTIPRGADTIDARGKTLLPGLWEMHAHFAQVEYGPAYLAAGVTTARDCGGEFEFITAVRDQIVYHNGLGPFLVLAGLVDGSGPGTFGVNWADTPGQGRDMVAKYRAAGFAQMKIYNQIKPEVLSAITDEAHRLGMTVTGHIPAGMTAFQGVEAGMDQINHLGPVAQEVRAVGLEKAVQFFKDHHTVIDPTLAWGELLSHSPETAIDTFEPGFAKAPFTLRSMIGSASGQGARLTESFKIVKALYEAGVPIVAGTDKAVPAHSLHRELELYVQAGIPPMDVIRLATIGSARAMGMARDVGSIEPGKRADMVLVDGNPL